MIEFSVCFMNDTKIPLYQQLYQFIRQEIECGRIAADTKLPSVRRLSESIQVSKTTIEEAYQQLLAEGYIVSQPKVGYFTAPQEEPIRTDTNSKPDISFFESQTKTNANDIDFHPARIDVEHFPSKIWKKITNEVWSTSGDQLLDYGYVGGEWGLRTAIERYLRYSRGVTCSPHQIIIGSGIQYSIQMLTHLLRDENTVIAMENPGYPRVRHVFERFGVPIRSIPLEKDGLNLATLRESDATMVYVTPSHQFPQGMVMSYHKRMQLLQWAKENNGLILEDDYDGEFRYYEKPIPSLQCLDNNDSVIYIGTFSKAFTPAIRMNYMVLPPKLLQRYMQHFQHQDCPVPRIQQAVMEQFIEQGHWEKHIRRMRRSYRNKHHVLVQSIRSEMGEKASITGYGAGLHISLKLRTNFSKSELIERAKTVGVHVYSMSDAWQDELDHPPYLYLGFGGLDQQEIMEGIKRLNSCWFQHSNS